jgi:outer membrane protein assembly factor BamB
LKKTTASALAFAALALLVSAAAESARADLYISDGGRVGRYSNSGALINADFITLDSLTGIAFGPDGNLYAATQNPGSIYQYNPNTGAQIGSGPFVFYEGTPPSPDPHDVNGPEGLHFGPDGNWYVADVTASNIHVYSSVGASLGALTTPSPSDPAGPLLSQPLAVAFDPQGRMDVANAQGVTRYDPATGKFTDLIPAVSSPPHPLNAAQDVAVDSSGHIYVVDSSGTSSDVVRYNSDGSFDRLIADFTHTSVLPVGNFNPLGITIGPDGNLYVSVQNLDFSVGEVLRYTQTGTFIDSFIGAGDFGDPTALTSSATFLAFSPAVPEPSSFFLLLAGLTGFYFLSRRRK